MSTHHTVVPVPVKVQPGSQFGILTVLRRSGYHRGFKLWRCRCSCGQEAFVDAWNLTRKTYDNCHWHSRALKPTPRKKQPVSKEYRAWKLLRSRCSNPRNPSFPWYGGKGIRVCERWNSFENFLADVGPAPTPQHSIDRYPNGRGHYEPGNCRWATPKEQHRNTSRRREIVAGGETHCLSEWAEKTGINADTIAGRLNRGWTVEEALGMIPRRLDRPGRGA